MDVQEGLRFGLSDRGERYHYILDTKSKTSRLGGFPGRDEEEMYKDNVTIVFLLSRFVFYLIRQFTWILASIEDRFH